MNKKTSLPLFINQFFKGGPPLSLDDIKTETQGFMSFYDTFLEINLFNIFSETTSSNLERLNSNFFNNDSTNLQNFSSFI